MIAILQELLYTPSAGKPRRIWILFLPCAPCRGINPLYFRSLLTFFEVTQKVFSITIILESELKNALDQFIEDVKETNCKEAQPYLASAIMQKAKYAFFPTTKFRYFNQGKELLENFIQAYPNNLEARYVRVLVQRNIPSILGYKDKIESDITFINSYIKEAKLPSDFKNVILSNIN